MGEVIMFIIKLILGIIVAIFFAIHMGLARCVEYLRKKNHPYTKPLEIFLIAISLPFGPICNAFESMHSH